MVIVVAVPTMLEAAADAADSAANGRTGADFGRVS